MNIYSLNLVSFSVFVQLCFCIAQQAWDIPIMLQSPLYLPSVPTSLSVHSPSCASRRVLRVFGLLKWNHSMFSLLCLSFLQPSVSDIHLLVDCFNSSAILLSSINAYEYILFYSAIFLMMGIRIDSNFNSYKYNFGEYFSTTLLLAMCFYLF